MEKDLYQVLGVSRSAKDEDIKKAYRKLARKYHPDVNPGDKKAEERFKEISHAHDVLGDPAKRRRYDQFGNAAFSGEGWPGAGAAGGFSGFDGFGDVFEEILGRRQSERGRRRRGSDLSSRLTVSFDEAFRGTQKSFTVDRRVRCDPCQGKGYPPGASLTPCSGCGGSGRRSMGGGPFQFGVSCESCGGEGRRPSRSCERCSGNGTVRLSDRISVRIPPGVKTGSKVRVAGKGEGGAGGARDGDLLLQVTVLDHPVFERDGDDLHCEVPISITEAALGGEVDVPTMDKAARIRIPAGTSSGKRIRLAGKGFPRSGGKGAGDLFVEIRIEAPTALTPEAEELLRRFDELIQHRPRKVDCLKFR